MVCGGYKGEFGLEWNPHRVHADVAVKLKSVMLRRMRKEVLPELPEKTRENVSVSIGRTLRNEMNELMEDINEEEADLLRRLMQPIIFKKISTIREALAAAKIPALNALVEEHEVESEPLVVFSSHRKPIEQLGDRPGWGIITGGVSAAKRTEVEKQFQAGELKGVACTIRSGGTGITLTRASHVIIVDPDWTPAMNSQAEDRLCRIGQTRGVVVDSVSG